MNRNSHCPRCGAELPPGKSSRGRCLACKRRRQREYRQALRNRDRIMKPRAFGKQRLSEAILTCLLPDELRQLRGDIDRLLASGYNVRIFQ